MNRYLTFLSVIEDKYFFGFEKKIKSITNALTSEGYISNYININDLSFKGFIKTIKIINNCNSRNIIVRTVGIKTFLLLFLIILVKKKQKNIY